MAPSSTIGSLTDELVATFVPSNTSPQKLRKLREGFNRKLRHHNYARTNQFEVADRLDGLQEKFLVLNHEELADALNSRLQELKNTTDHSPKWLPDIQHLLLQLSDDPVHKTQVEDLIKLKKFTEVIPQLRWEDVEADDPVDRKSQIWREAEYSDLSSDEDPVVSTATTPPQTPDKGHKYEQRCPSLYLTDRDAVPDQQSQIARHQFWKAEPDSNVTVTELQAIREALFMLQGLPTTLFWRVGHSIEIDMRFHLSHVSDHVLRDLLTSFGQMGISVDVVRTWLSLPQTVSFMQSLHAGIEKAIIEFDANISQIQSGLLNPRRTQVASLLEVLEDVVSASNHVLQLARFVNQAATADPVKYLENLYEEICVCQASGDDDRAESLYRLFSSSFETYLKPVVKWISEGELDATSESSFIKPSGQSKVLSCLWKSWYSLDETSGPGRAPQFMKPVLWSIFVTGKSRIFLHHLQRSGSSYPPRLEKSFSLTELRSLRPIGLVPFPQFFQETFERAIRDFHISSCATLREKLGVECGLWRILDAFDYVFFGKSGYRTDAIDEKMFDRIDKGSRAWNDRFLVVESYQEVLGTIESVDAERIVVNSNRASSRDMQSQRRSVKILSNMSLDYTLPWPIANVISRNALKIYQRISNFLFQIRRARYVLERGCRISVMTGRLHLELGQRNLAQRIHRQLLVFINCLYDHLTTVVIETATNEMRLSFAAAIDVDEMILVPQTYIAKLEGLCLISKQFSTIRQAVTVVLDLCIRFSDTVTSPLRRRSSDVDAASFRSATSRFEPSRRMDDSSSGEDTGEDEEGFSTFITFDEHSYESILKDIQLQFDRQRSFIVAGLRSVGRIDEQGETWSYLAERLDWKHHLRFV